MIRHLDVKLGAIELFKFECFMCGGFNFEEAGSIKELTDTLVANGWRDCVIGDSEGIFCPDCIEEGKP